MEVANFGAAIGTLIDQDDSVSVKNIWIINANYQQLPLHEPESNCLLCAK